MDDRIIDLLLETLDFLTDLTAEDVDETIRAADAIVEHINDRASDAYKTASARFETLRNRARRSEDLFHDICSELGEKSQ